jgi:hypothetical protein
MSWFKNLFRKKRLPARDHIGRFLSNDKGEMLFTDSPVEEIEKAKAKALKRDEERKIATLKFLAGETIGCKCGGTCHCDPKVKPKTVAKKAPAKSTEKKTAIKSDLEDKPVAKKKPAPKKK